MQAEATPEYSADHCESLSQIEQILHAASTLGPLPPIVRYFDEYEEELRSVDPKAVTWAIRANGSTGYLRFENLRPGISSIVKCFTISQLHKNAITGRRRIQRLVAVPDILEKVIILACRSPQATIEYLRIDIRAMREVQDLSGLFSAVKSLLYYFCEISFSGWDIGFFHILRTIGSPVKTSDYRTVCDGSAILSFEEECKIVGYFDDLNNRVHCGCAESISSEELRDAYVLFWNYAHGMRPIQIANRNISHVRLRSSPGRNPIVHITFGMQSSDRQRKLWSRPAR